MECFVCIHCHFYQPPRENPWLEVVESQESAKPYHDWNERIAAECYRPNGASRILDGQGRIAQIVNNYARISFNFGPTLLSWMQEHAAQTYEHILQADGESQQRFSGHGSALAQAYNHVILPLANSRDKQTQIAWGMADFQQRYGRDPEGMWLPETAVDTESLEIVSAAGIKFTVLSPYQAQRFRRDSTAEWIDLHGHGIDPKRPYLCRLPSGRSIGVFFYDGVVAQAVAFDKLLFDGRNLAQRLVSRFDLNDNSAQLVHIATDGETYGHHHTHGDMALAYALDHIERNKLAKITNYGEYFAKHPPVHEVEIRERTSWSCAHGVARWESNCGCNSTLHGGWHQEWRGPLREALDGLRDELATLYEQDAARFLKDPWAARDAYISVILDRSAETLNAFLREHCLTVVSDDEQTHLLRLLEMQRFLLLMYTSCGWFFDELSGPETVQVLRYAGRAAQLGEQLFGEPYEEELLRWMERAPSNLPEFGNGRKVYERFVSTAMLDMPGAAAHYVIGSLFDGYAKRESVYCYAADLHDAQVFAEGRKKLAIGQARITSQSTQAKLDFNFAVLCHGDHRLIAGIGPSDDGEFSNFTQKASAAFSEGDFGGCSKMVENYFGPRVYSLPSLFYDEQQRIIARLIEASLAEIDEVSRKLHEQHAQQISFLSERNVPLPAILHTLGQFALSNAIRQALAEERPNFEQIREILNLARRDGIAVQDASLNPALRHKMDAVLRRWQHKPDDVATLRTLEAIVLLAQIPPFHLDLWEAQNQFYEVMQAIASSGRLHVDATWLHHFYRLGDELGVAPAQPFETALTHSAGADGEIAPKAKDSARSTRTAGPSERAQLPI
jgi:alpha-amylase/alpha-mannosidase (GH57 family)